MCVHAASYEFEQYINFSISTRLFIAPEMDGAKKRDERQASIREKRN